MKDRLSDEQNEAVLKALNDAIEKGPWDKSNFLKVVGKNLIEIRDGFINQLGASSRAQLKAESHLANRIALRSGQQEIFISLYSADGTTIQSWEKIIANLPKQMISRPIYADEADVKALLKTKENKQNEAYVAIYINQSDILQLSSDKAPVDKLGKMLLTLKDKTLNLENISRFVHISGVYKYERNRLIKIS
ncbi:Dot/Icm secretion system protein IcmQ [Legionella quateirensis]|uniref:IcmQ n=1 Tax=Legionella quateirensis TaxID=45072 RepID=Q49JC3_9GAMM|nr:Dot/Icm secretion system protein IcmQ [Legionella quateirensis]AAX56153.1 IcmQ [Legionella quateirensis]KTD55415.1 IcmQ protein [Legionella quateirensis]STY16589.1 IcmQ protein [Legionella quateirensis]